MMLIDQVKISPSVDQCLQYSYMTALTGLKQRISPVSAHACEVSTMREHDHQNF